MQDEELVEMVKEFTLKTDCLEAVKFIVEHPLLLSKQAVEVLERMIKVRDDDPIKGMLEYNLKLVQILGKLLQPKKAPSTPP